MHIFFVPDNICVKWKTENNLPVTKIQGWTAHLHPPLVLRKTCTLFNLQNNSLVITHSVCQPCTWYAEKYVEHSNKVFMHISHGTSMQSLNNGWAKASDLIKYFYLSEKSTNNLDVQLQGGILDSWNCLWKQKVVNEVIREKRFNELSNNAALKFGLTLLLFLVLKAAKKICLDNNCIPIQMACS